AARRGGGARRRALRRRRRVHVVRLRVRDRIRRGDRSGEQRGVPPPRRPPRILGAVDRALRAPDRRHAGVVAGGAARVSALIRYSTFPSTPLTGLSITPFTSKPISRANATTDSTAAARLASSRTMPPLPTSRFPTSNCGLMSPTTSPRATVATA